MKFWGSHWVALQQGRHGRERAELCIGDARVAPYNRHPGTYTLHPSLSLSLSLSHTHSISLSLSLYLSLTHSLSFARSLSQGGHGSERAELCIGTARGAAAIGGAESCDRTRGGGDLFLTYLKKQKDYIVRNMIET